MAAKESSSRLTSYLKNLTMRYMLLLALIVLQVARSASAEIKLPALFSDGAVLQREMAVPIWGTATANADITIALDDEKQSIKADATGKWTAKLAAHKAGGPHVLRVSEMGGNSLEVKDLQFGEVWIASGQSNMHWSFSHNIKDKEKELDAANDPLLRQFTVKKGNASQPMSDTAGKWLGANRENLLVDGTNGCSAVGYFFARSLRKELNVPVGIINASVGGTPIQAWSPKGGLFNNMIHPLAPFAIRGAIWYQGEANVAQGMGYVDLKKSMVGAWRDLWGQGEFPFYFVQLAPFNYATRPNSKVPAHTLPLFWEAQSKIPAVLAKSDFVVITDLVENVADIHPSNKQDVGDRLARLARAHDYGQSSIAYSGPRFKSAKVEASTIRVQFDHLHGGLLSRDDKPLTTFLIAGEDKKFVPAEAKIDGDSVVVSSADVTKPVAVRFAWDERAMPNLANKAGLPANSFRSDDWTLDP